MELHRSYENCDYDFDTNGERRVLKKLATVFGPAPMLFDVGANRGDWALTASRLFSGATIHAFEIVPQTFSQLQQAVNGSSSIHCHNVGMSDRSGELTVYFPEGSSAVATAVPGFAEQYHSLNVKPVVAQVVAGDEFCDAAGNEAIDLLKIDVEGHEDRVLKGFQRRLSESRVKVVQFEYGRINIDTHFLLKDFYEMLAGFGYRIGKIYPGDVAFREYRHEHEDFLGPNYLAVHHTCERELRVLKANR
jgi:FkbM family methyltransferase